MTWQRMNDTFDCATTGCLYFIRTPRLAIGRKWGIVFTLVWMCFVDPMEHCAQFILRRRFQNDVRCMHVYVWVLVMCTILYVACSSGYLLGACDDHNHPYRLYLRKSAPGCACPEHRSWPYTRVQPTSILLAKSAVMVYETCKRWFEISEITG